ncbi:hypothetical protein ACHAQA_001139 [Verticillium albo-atrum]
MPDHNHHDPYEWDVEELVSELCGEGRSWAPLNPKKRPDSEALARSLRQHEVDGELLLSWEDEFQTLDTLFADLGLTKSAHKFALKKVIANLKKRSPAYKKAQTQLAADERTDPSQNPEDVEMHNVQPLTLDTTVVNGSLNMPPTPITSTSAAAPSKRHTTPPTETSPPLEPTQKKRRIVPQFISAEMSRQSRVPIPTAADAIVLPAAAATFAFAPQKPGPIYIQSAKLITKTMVPRSTLDPSTSSNDTGQIRGEFGWVRSKYYPPGTRMQISRAMMRLFRANDKLVHQMAHGITPFLGSALSSDVSSEDGLLPLFGDSDDEAGYDSDTLREMEEEANEGQKPPSPLTLGNDEVDTILEDFIQGIVASWTEVKLPRLQRKANMLWNQAYRNDRNRQIHAAVTRVVDLNRRIAKLRAEIMIQDWVKPNQVHQQARCMEASIEDREHQSWLVNMLKGREPPRVKLLPGSQPKATPKPTNSYSDEEGDLITSEAEDTEDYLDFVVNDEMDILTSGQPAPEFEALGGAMDVDPPSPHSITNGRVPPATSAWSPEAKMESPSRLGNTIDLTAADRIITSTARNSVSDLPEVIDLVTPEKPQSLAPDEMDTGGSFGQAEIPNVELNIPFTQPQNIAAIGLDIWEAHNDSRRLTVAFLWSRPEPWRNAIFDLIKNKNPDELWRDFVLPACRSGLFTSQADAQGGGTSKLRTILCRLFSQYVCCRKVQRLKGIGKEGKQMILASHGGFVGFCKFITQHVIPNFPKVAVPRSNSPTLDGELSEDDMSGQDESADHNDTPSKRRRRRVVKEDQSAKGNREANFQKHAHDEQRTLELQRRLAASATISGDRSRLIINASKEGDDDKDFVYVNDVIAERIKDHQIEGVRFMWNQVVTGKQGCLLAHTMGLGKTMQIITLLIAITEASASPEPTVRAQIPERLRRSQTLVICPTGLVDNWKEELGSWDRHAVLGDRFTVDSKQDQGQRKDTIKEWDERGGVLIIGYDMFRNLAFADDTTRKIFTDRPNIVVADEAHRLKNQKSKLHAIGSRFLTPSRIALTGSPLANNVGEFYSMIDWIAENYLGPLKEFNSYYANPIQEGLYGDSSHGEYRLAKKRLAILEKTVAPKTHRLTIKALKNELPDKIEFFLTVPLTPLQEELYDLYVRSVRENAESQADSTFAVLDNMILLNNHPRCYHEKLIKEKKTPRAPQGGNSNGASQDTSITPAFLTKSMKIFKRCQDVNDVNLSWKVKVLVAILDECRKLKEKVLIFSQSIPTIDWLSYLFKQQQRPYSRLTGETVPGVRQNMVKSFNEGNNEIFVISTQAGGQGLNITGASRVVIFDFRFNPIAEQQAIGRAYRIGQSKPVIVYRFVSGGTYEQHLYNKAVWKMQLASRVVDKDNPKRWSTKIKDAFTKDYKEPEQAELAEYRGKDSVLDSVLSSPELATAIRSIIVTDTFEEEDPNDYIFDAQESQEVDRMVLLEHARITDPIDRDFDDILQTYDPGDKAKVISEAVQQQLNGRGDLPIMSSWRTLNLFAQGQSFAAGVLSGLVTIDFLVNTKDDSVFQQRAQELSSMDRRELKEQLLQALRRPYDANV